MSIFDLTLRQAFSICKDRLIFGAFGAGAGFMAASLFQSESAGYGASSSAGILIGEISAYNQNLKREGTVAATSSGTVGILAVSAASGCAAGLLVQAFTGSAQLGQGATTLVSYESCVALNKLMSRIPCAR